MNEHNKYLYRALREEEIDAGNILIPKSKGPFRSDRKFGIDMIFPFEFDNVKNAVRQHQWKRRGLSTSGISTTPHLERAKDYNTYNLIVKIDRHRLTEFGIKEYDADKYLRPEEITCPEDDEIILVKEDGGSFPKEIIVNIIKNY